MTRSRTEWPSGRISLLAAAGVLFGTATVLAGAGLLASSGYLISRAALRPPIAELMLVFVAVRFFGLARPALRYAERLLSHDATFRLLTRLRSWFVRTLLPLSRGQLRQFRAGDLLSRSCADVDALQEAWLRVGSPALVAVAASAIATAALASVHPTVALVVAGLLLFTGVFGSWIASRMAQGLGEARNRERRALTEDLVSLLQGLPDVLAFGYESRALAAIGDRQRRLDAVDDTYGWRLGFHAAMSTAATYVGFLAALYLTIVASETGDLSIVWIAPIALAVVAAFESVDNLPAAWQFAGQTRESAARIAEMATLVPAVPEPVRPRQIDTTAAPAIQFRHVTFAYGEHEVLRDVSLAVPSGEHVGIRGSTGSGKSTLLDLVVRTWDPRNGTVHIGSVDVRDVTREHLRRTVAVMPQHVHVFNTTLRENVRLTRPETDDEELRRALAKSQLAEFLDGLPDGLDTILGEHGARLSAGERRRLAFARLLLTDAPVVLLDEPTEHLDAASERAMIRELKVWAEGRTMVIVSHREAPMAIVDRAVVIHDGRLENVSDPSV